MNHFWINGAKILLDKKEETNNNFTYLLYLITDHIREINNYIKK